MKSNIAKRGICIIAVSVLAACAQFGKQAPLEEPTVYSLSDGKSASLIQDGWWLQLKDNKLNQLVAQAIQTSTDLRIAKARLEQAQAQLGITEAAGKTPKQLADENNRIFPYRYRPYIIVGKRGSTGKLDIRFLGKKP